MLNVKTHHHRHKKRKKKNEHRRTRVLEYIYFELFCVVHLKT